MRRMGLAGPAASLWPEVSYCCNVFEEILLNFKLNDYLYICDKHDNLIISRRRNSVKLSWASSSIECLNGEYTSVSRTISVLVIRELNTSDIGLSVPWRQEFYSCSTT
jgi:hypothetical protein